jgi:hypothetical protein
VAITMVSMASDAIGTVTSEQVYKYCSEMSVEFLFVDDSLAVYGYQYQVRPAQGLNS